MEFYKIVLKSIPELSMAHSYETSSYNIAFKKQENKLEISYIEMGDVEKTHEDGRVSLYKAPFVSISICDSPSRNLSHASLHRHYTFGVNVEYDLYKISAEHVVECWQSDFSNEKHHKTMAMLPEYVSDKKCIDAIESLIKKIIYKHSVNTSAENLSCIGDVFAVLSQLTSWSVSYAASLTDTNVSPDETIYCTKAARYIAENIENKLYVNEIAEYLGLSVGHLSRIFKAATGYSVIEYINRQKIDKAKQLFESKTSSVRDAAAAVGIADEKYFSRLFKQYTGMTASEYKETLKIRAEMR